MSGFVPSSISAKLTWISSRVPSDFRRNTRMRFRAVLMTAFSFILGVIPLLVASGAGAASRQVLGTVVFAGMVVATLVGVIAIPMLYFVIQSISEKFGKAAPLKDQSAHSTGS